jgi:hypothetical protein
VSEDAHFHGVEVPGIREDWIGEKDLRSCGGGWQRARLIFGWSISRFRTHKRYWHKVGALSFHLSLRLLNSFWMDSSKKQIPRTLSPLRGYERLGMTNWEIGATGSPGIKIKIPAQSQLGRGTLRI